MAVNGEAIKCIEEAISNVVKYDNSIKNSNEASKKPDRTALDSHEHEMEDH